MSKRVLFTCTLLLLIGLAGAWHILEQALLGRVFIDVSAFFIPVSIGLFLGHASARTAAACLFGLIYLACAVFLVMVLVSGPPAIRVSGWLFDSGLAIVFVFASVICSICGFIHWMLYTPPFDEHLGNRPGRKNGAAS